VRSIFFGGYCPEEFQRIAHSFVHLRDSGQTLLKPGDISPCLQAPGRLCVIDVINPTDKQQSIISISFHFFRIYNFSFFEALQHLLRTAFMATHERAIDRLIESLFSLDKCFRLTSAKLLSSAMDPNQARGATDSPWSGRLPNQACSLPSQRLP